MSKNDDLEKEGEAESIVAASAADSALDTGEMITDTAGIGMMADSLDGDTKNAAAPKGGGQAEKKADETKETPNAETQGAAQGVEAQNSEQNKQWKAWGAGVQERTGNGDEQAAETQGAEQGEEGGKGNDSAVQAQRHHEAHRQTEEQALNR